MGTPSGLPIGATAISDRATGNELKPNADGSVNVVVNNENASLSGAIALTSPPANTNVGADTPLTFSQKVNRFIVQNNSPANAYVELDAAASTASLVLIPGAYWSEPIQVTVLHVFTAAAQPVNAASGIVVKGWL